MIEPDAVWHTTRLVAEPVTVRHAAEVHPLLGDESMYLYTGGSAPTLAELETRYRKLETRRSADGSEFWCNWVLRTTSGGEAVGLLQATLPTAGPSADMAEVAWTIGTAHQRHGYASEAAKELVRRLHQAQWCVVAHIHPDHLASQRVAQRAGFAPTARTVDSEVRWWTDPWDGVELVDPQFEPWLPEEVTRRLADVEAPWCVAAGWALDLFRGAQTREHEDLEIAVPIGRFDAVQNALAGYTFDVVGAGHRWPVDSPAFDVMVQTWLRAPDDAVYRLDVFREPHDEDVWICRRNHSIRRPYRDIIEVTSEGVPYLAPEVVLLFKAKHTRAKDHDDFHGVLPLLNTERKRWLRQALTLVHPGHIWLEAIT